MNSRVTLCWKLGAAIALACLLLGGYYLHYLKSRPVFDGLIVRVLARTASIDSYAELAETDVSISQRRLLISGVYKVDLKAGKFASDSTTTLVATRGSIEAPSGVFSLQNISIGDDVYYRVSTKSKDLLYILSRGTEWNHFVKGSIPPEVSEVAISGPILDDLALFRSGNDYISIAHKVGVSGSSTQYLLHLSGVSAPTEGPLNDLLTRIGNNGHIDLWVNAETADIERIHFSGNGYESTTTILNLNSPQDVTAPLLSK